MWPSFRGGKTPSVAVERAIAGRLSSPRPCRASSTPGPAGALRGGAASPPRAGAPPPPRAPPLPAAARRGVGGGAPPPPPRGGDAEPVERGRRVVQRAVACELVAGVVGASPARPPQLDAVRLVGTCEQDPLR